MRMEGRHDYSEKWEIFIGAGEFLEGDIYIEDEAIKEN